MKGFSLVELMITIGLTAIFLPALATGFVASREGKVQQAQRLEAISLLKESQEAVRSVREAGWAVFAQNGTFYPAISGSTWQLLVGEQTSGDFIRRIVISDVYRDQTGAIASLGGTLDPSTKKIIITVSWGTLFPSSVSTASYLTRYLENASYTETTRTDFNKGTISGVAIRSTSGSFIPDDGEIVLGAGGQGDWCGPVPLEPGLDLPGSGYANAVTAVEGKVFAGTGENSSGLSFMGINISNAQPPTPSFGSVFDGHKTNGVFGETNYGYITTDTNAKEAVIINLNTSPYTEAGYFNAPGNGTGRGIFVYNNVGYMTADSILYNFNLTSKSGSRPILDTNGVQLSGIARNVYVVGNYAYVSTENTANEFQIIDVSNPTNMSILGQLNLPGGVGRGIYVSSSGTRAYVVTATSAQKEFFIIDTTNKTDPQILGSYETNGMDPQGITVVPGNRAIIVGRGGEEYQVIDISAEGSPTKCGGAQQDSGINGVASVLEADGDAYSYIVTSESEAEFKILAGGPGGSFATQGIYESETFSPGYQTANNRFSATFNQPQETDIKFQVSLANMVSGVCPVANQFTFVGPDGTTATYFEQASSDPITFPFTTYQTYVNPGQCMRYRAYFSTLNLNNSPVLYDTTINYSP